MDGKFKNMSPTPTPSSFPADCSKAVPLLQFFFVCALVVPYVVIVLSLTLLLLNTACPVLANSVVPDQLASEEAN